MNSVQELVAGRPGFDAMRPAFQDEAIRINDFIYMSQGTSNAYMVLTKAGRVIINCGMGFEAITHKRVFDAVSSGPTTHILLTQGHVDHVGGVSRFREPGTTVIAQRNNDACQHDDARIQTVRVAQSGTWFQPVFDAALKIAAVHPDAFVQDRPRPDINFDDHHSFETGGVQFELFSTPGGETIDSCVVWLPQYGILFSGNMTGPLFPHFPNINTIRGDKYRSLEAYCESIERVRSLNAELLITGHFEPIAGRDLIRESFDQLYTGAQHVYRATLEGMNAGKDIFTLMREIRLPPGCDIGQGYGKVSWAVRTLWEMYMGWFKAQSSSELYATQPRDIYSDLLQLAGSEAILARGREKLAAGDIESALHFSEIALAKEDANALRFARDVHESLLARAADNFWEAGWLRAQIAGFTRALERLEKTR